MSFPITSIVGQSPVRYAFEVVLLVEGKGSWSRADVQVTEPSTSFAKQEKRETAVSSWKFSSWGIWKDSGFNTGLK